MSISRGCRPAAPIPGVRMPAGEGQIRRARRYRPVRVPVARSCVLRALSAAVAAGLFSAGCGHGRPDATSSVAASVRAPSPGAVPAHSKNAVIDAYTGLFDGVGRALQAPPDQVRQILANLTSGEYL